MIQFRSWQKHNSRALKDVDSKRTKRGVDLDAPLSMQRILLVTHLDEDFAAFAAAVGGAVAETYFIRAMQYAAEHDGRRGCIRVERALFGPIVLSKKWHVVSRATGEKVYDALLASRICVRIAPAGGPETAPESPLSSVDLSADKSADTSTDKSADSRARDAHAPRPGAPACGGASRAGRAPRLYARDARGLETPDSEGGLSADTSRPPSPSPSPSDSPVAPGGGGGSSASPTSAAAGAPLTAGERAVAAVLVAALDAGRLAVESTEEAAERMRAAKFAQGGHEEDREKARARHAELVEHARQRRAEAIDALRAGGPDARPWIERLQVIESVRLYCVVARKGARADERDQRSAARKVAR